MEHCFSSIDPEDYFGFFGEDEVVKLRDDIESSGLSIIVLSWLIGIIRAS